MKAHSTFLDYVMPYVPGATVELATLELKKTCIEFCEKSLIIQRDHDPVTVIASTGDYDFESPITNHLVTKVMKMWFKGSVMNAINPDEITDPTIYNTGFDGAVIAKSTPQAYFQKDERTFTIYPRPSATSPSAITMRVALKPSRSALLVEDVLLEDYAEEIGAGAIARLMMSPGKPYTSPSSGALYQARFMQGVNTARQRVLRGYVRSDARIQIPEI
jgi:hypothetical protein